MIFYYLFLGIAPSVLLLWFFYRKDKWEPEPKLKVMKIFVGGLLATIPAIFLTHIFLHHVFEIDYFQMKVSFTLNLVACFLVISPIQELFKYATVKVSMYNDKEFNEPMDGVIYMVAAGLGFAAFENLTYIWAARDMGDATIAGILRGVLATPAHACFAGFLGLYLGKAKFVETKKEAFFLILKGFLLAVVLHATYDAITYSPLPYRYLAIAFLIILWAWLMKEIKAVVDQSPFRSPEPTSEEQVEP